ncbi:MAG: Zn-ribbon domain-containing OB-fold protein [Candidatus Freyarchaeota archaeon]|nr:Zn-ribbon domain-containing OB-fold protein [Candidatus Freyrarchaeum guaymaensis]
MSSSGFTVKAFKDFLKERKLMGAKCRSCGMVNFPPRPLCKSCHGSELEWVELEGKGTLVTFSVVYVAPTPLVAEGYGRDNPYVFGVVDLGQGAKVTARIVEVDAKKPETIKIGMNMEAVFIERNGETVLAFKPA